MLRVGYELTIPMFERAKTVHALDGAATLIGTFYHLHILNDMGYKNEVVTSMKKEVVACSWLLSQNSLGETDRMQDNLDEI
jgi:hypothetical protein